MKPNGIAWVLGLVLSLGAAMPGVALAGGSPSGPKPKAAPKKKSPKPAPRPAPKARPKAKPKRAAPRIFFQPPPRPGAKVVHIRAREIYLGRYKGFHRAAVIDLQKVFDAISFYQELKRTGLTKKSGRYWILLQKANRIFYKALRKLAKKEGYDLIGGRGAIDIDGQAPPDVTPKVVALIPTVRLY